MTKKLGTDQEIQDVDGEVLTGEAEDISEMQNDIDAEMQSIFAEFGGDVLDTEFKISVRRVEKNTGDTELCFKATPTEISGLSDRIIEEYGAGTYEIWIYRNGRRFRKRKLKIAQPLKKPVDKLVQESKQDLAALVSTMMEQQRESMRQMQELLTRQQPAASTTDPVNMMTAMMGAMVQMKEFMQPQQQGDQMGMFIKGIEIAKDIASGGAEKNFHDTVINLAKEFAPPLIKMAAVEQQAKAAMPQPQQPAPNPNPQQLTQQQEQPQMSEAEQQAFIQFKPKVDFLVAKAASGSDPGFMADMILEFVSPDEIRQFIARPDALEYLAHFNPEVKKYAPFFEALRDELQELTKPEPEPDLTPTPKADIQEVESANEASQEIVINETGGGSQSSENP